MIRQPDDLRRLVTAVREEKGLDQTDVAQRADCSRVTVSKLENGGNLNMDMVFTILRALDITLYDHPPEPEPMNEQRRDFGAGPDCSP